MTTATPAIDPVPQASHEVGVARLLASSEEAGWRIPIALTAQFPFAGFAASVEKAAHGAPVLLLEIVLPCPPASMVEQARYRCAATPPRYALRVTDQQWCSALAFAALFGLTMTPEQMLALMVGERLSRLEPPSMPRPFIPKWAEAVRTLAQACTEMGWMSLSLAFDRLAVHKARKCVIDDVMQLGGGWGVAGRTGVTP
jgi:hypothetical protein